MQSLLSRENGEDAYLLDIPVDHTTLFVFSAFRSADTESPVGEMRCILQAIITRVMAAELAHRLLYT